LWENKHKNNISDYIYISYFTMQVVIIGHKGYIGSYLYKNILKTIDAEVLPYDSRAESARSGLYSDGLGTADVVIYLAGITGRKQCNAQCETTRFKGNVIDIMEVAHKMKNGALLIYASTASLYEGYGNTYASETDVLYTHLYDEYTKSMYLREHNMRTISHIRTIGLRLGTVIGISPNQRRDLVHIALLRSAVLTGVATVFGADQHRSILWNRDLLDVILRIIERRNEIKRNAVYNVASFNCTVAKIANEIGCQTGCNLVYKDDAAFKNTMGFSMDTSSIERDFGISWKGTNRRIIDDLKTDLQHICYSPEYLVPTSKLGVESSCRVCKQTCIDRVIDFGNQPNANHYVSSPEHSLPEYPLSLERCRNCFHLQLGYTIPPAEMFSDYIYLSGTSNTLKEYFVDFVNTTIRDSGVTERSGNVLDIACNDGTLLDEYARRGWKTYGYDAAKNIYEISSRKGHNVTVGFWGVDPVPEYPPLDVIVAQNVCAHVPDPVVFLEKCKDVMNPNTVLYIQTSQCNMVEYGQFDTIYHEHLSFFTIHSMWVAAKMAGLVIDGIAKTSIHGVSYVFRLRLTSSLDVLSHPLYVYERNFGLYDDLAYYVYVEKIKSLREWMLQKIHDMHDSGIRVVGYGAAAKGMTILNYMDNKQLPLEYIVDDSPKKHGYYATNSKYWITSPDKLAEYSGRTAIIVFAWNFLAEIMEKIKRIRTGMETYLIVPYPRKAIYRISAEGKTYKVYEEIDTRYNSQSLHHKTILFSHFYNEEILLTQWIRHHAPLFDCAVLIDHKSTDTSRKIIAREAPESWNLVNSHLNEFCAQETDNEVAGYENSFDNNDWRLALTTTEFLMTLGLRRKENTTFDNMDGKRAIQIQSVSMIDTDPDATNTQPYNVIAAPKKSGFYFCEKPEHEKTKVEKYMNGHYNRFMHNIRDFTNPYWLGRHNFKHPAKPSNLHILKCLYTPFPDFFARKLQIRARIPESNAREGWGFQHLGYISDVVEQYADRRKMPLLELTDVDGNMRYYDKYMRDKSGDDSTNDMLLTGVFMNLYDTVAERPTYAAQSS
jgi:nucleoside-diphosphate-sugar epimerase/SAM-dependent methyltransferase